MSKLLEKNTALNDLIVQGKAMEAFEKYYDENEPEPVANQKCEREFFDSIIEFKRATALNITFRENTTMVEWHYDYTHKE